MVHEPGKKSVPSAPNQTLFIWIVYAQTPQSCTMDNPNSQVKSSTTVLPF